MVLTTVEECEHELSRIFTQLKEANTCKVTVRKASYLPVTADLSLVCVDWNFVDTQGEAFADFCAYYHIMGSKGTKPEFKIINVVSHELSNSLSLPIPFLIDS